MSGKPYPEGVLEVKRMVCDYQDASIELNQLQKTIADAEAKLLHAKDRCANLHRDIAKKLQAMDVHSHGNAGWEARTIWFLAELVRVSR